jgi:hypothetical protein
LDFNINEYIKVSLDIKEQLKYMFIISVEGNDLATNLSWILLSNSVPVLPTCFVETWKCETKLIPYIHYIPLKNDFSDLDEQIEWGLKNIDKCEEIAYMSKMYILQFFDKKKEQKIIRDVVEVYKKNVESITTKKKKNILIMMSDNRKLENNLEKAYYNSLVASINYEYSKKYNYDFIYYRPYFKDKNVIKTNNCIDPNTNNERHCAWSKLLSTSKALELEYDYVIYIDSDCIFKNFDISLEDFINPYINKDIIFLNNKPWGNDLPCSGFYICNVTKNTKQFINDWYNVNIPEYNINHTWEQAALHRIYKNYNIEIVDSWMFREEEDQYLRHVSSSECQNRISYFTNFIKEKNINYNLNINEINIIDFDTAKYYSDNK